jgi:hypothetical protein
LGTIYVARSKTLSQWGYDVGISKHIYKVGVTDGAVKDVVAAGWAGETDWVLVKKQDDAEVTESDLIARVALREKMVDPSLYPRIRETQGIFKIVPTKVENHFMVSRALSGEPEIRGLKVKHPEIADYLIAIGTS